MFTEEANEEWRSLPIEGYEHYQVSNLGRVKNGNKILKGSSHNGLEKRVQLSNNGKTKTMQIARLVAMCFHKKYSDSTNITYIDGDNQNCKANNLELKNKEYNEDCQWKDIKDYEGLYQVSDSGLVRSLHYRKGDRVVIMTPKVGRGGYLVVGLRKNNKKKFHSIHRLVAVTFLGEPASPNMQPNHKNFDKKQNAVWNLEWTTPKENTLHAIANGKFKNSEKILKEANKRRSKEIIATNALGKEQKFPSIRETSRILNIDRKQIKTSISKGNIQKGYKFRYA